MQADGLQLIPASAKRAAGIQYEINLDRAGMTASELIDVDIKASPYADSAVLLNPGHMHPAAGRANHPATYPCGGSARTIGCHAMPSGKGEAIWLIDTLWPC